MNQLLLTIHAWVAARYEGGKDERGATMVEYGLLIALIAVVVAVAAATLGTAIAAKFTTVAGSVTSAN